jgi:hypothetical protein
MNKIAAAAEPNGKLYPITLRFKLFFRKVHDAELRMPSSLCLSCLNVDEQVGYGDWLSAAFEMTSSKTFPANGLRK